MSKLFCVTYMIDYVHRVVIGVKAENKQAAIIKAQDAFDDAVIWDDTEEMPLLFDDYEEIASETLRFDAEEVLKLPKPDFSVINIKRKEFAFEACRALLRGELDNAQDSAKNAMPDYLARIKGTGNDSLWNQMDKQDTSVNLTTSEILTLANSHRLEVSLLLSGGLRSTHFIDCDSHVMCRDEGCDGAIRNITVADFLLDYPDERGKIWRIDQMIPQKDEISDQIEPTDKTRVEFDLCREKGLPFGQLFPDPDKHLPANFADAVRCLTRPYYPITDALYEEIMAVTRGLNTDIVIDDRGKQMTFGNADDIYQLMPLIKRI